MIRNKTIPKIFYHFASILIVLLVLSNTSAWAATYFVDPNGSDSNSGSIDSPFKSLNTAISSLKPGDTLNIRGGNYGGVLASHLGTTFPSGTAGNPVTIQAYNNETVNLKGSIHIGRQNGGPPSHITFDGINIDAKPSPGGYANSGISINGGANNITFMNGEVKNSASTGGISTGYHNDPNPGGDMALKFINMNVHHNGLDSSYYTAQHTARHHHGYYIKSGGVLIEGGTIHDNGGFGIHQNIKSTDPRLQNNVYRNNDIYGHSNGSGIIITGSDGALVYNNLLRNNLRGISVSSIADPRDTKVFNNTAFNNTIGIEVSAPLWGNKGPFDTEVFNNISYQNKTDYIDNGINTTENNNLFDTDPQFTNPGGGDFSLKAGSPAIGAGVAIPGISAPGVTPDIGANPSGLGGTPSGGSAPPASTNTSCLSDTPSLRTLYVSPNAAGNGDGSQGSPFQTIQDAADNAKPGDTIIVAPGTYEAVVTSNSGTAENRIRYVSEVPGGAKISSTRTFATWKNEGDYVDIEGFDLTGDRFAYSGIQNAGSYVRVVNNRVHDYEMPKCQSYGGAGIGQTNYDAVGNEIIGNVVHDIATAHIKPDGSPRESYCNFIHGIYHSTLGGQIQGNTVYRAAGWGIHLWHAADNVNITNNLVFNNGAKTNNGTIGGGIVIGAGDKPYNITNDNTTVANNIVRNNRGRSIREAGNVGTNNLITDNIIYENGIDTPRLINAKTQGNQIGVDPLQVNFQPNGGGNFALASNSPARSTFGSEPSCSSQQAPASNAGGGPSCSSDTTPIKPGRTIYVSANGSDSNSGDAGQPFASLQAAADAAKGGDTILVESGTYDGFRLRDLHPPEGQWITFKGEPGAIINTGEKGNGIRISGASNIVIDGFEITNLNKPDPATLQSKLKCTLTSGDIQACKSKAASLGASGNVGIQIESSGSPNANSDSHNIVIRNNEIHNNIVHGISGGGKGGHNIEVVNNHIHDNGVPGLSGGYGTYISGENNLISGNIVHGNVGNNLRLGNTSEGTNLSNSIVENNLTFDGKGPFLHAGSGIRTDATGIRLHGGGGNTFRDNVSYGNEGIGISINGNEYNKSPDDSANPNQVYNNTSYDNGMQGIYLSNNADATNNTAFDNGQSIAAYDLEVRGTSKASNNTIGGDNPNSIVARNGGTESNNSVSGENISGADSIIAATSTCLSGGAHPFASSRPPVTPYGTPFKPRARASSDGAFCSPGFPCIVKKGTGKNEPKTDGRKISRTPSKSKSIYVAP
ncbi:MAG: hypothetical protein DHS20C02_02710 [Micavibrio sp.]|nr:MAG: hypothetical protein DHS20C02_02710 [Micavibrio sp.]